MPLQISVSRGSLSGFPLMYHTRSARRRPGSTIMVPMMTVRRVRMVLPTLRASSRCASRPLSHAFGEGCAVEGVERVVGFNPAFAGRHHAVSDVAQSTDGVCIGIDGDRHAESLGVFAQAPVQIQAVGA